MGTPGSAGLEDLATAELLELAEEAGRLGIFEWRVPDDVVRLSPRLIALFGLGSFDGRFASWLDGVFREDKPRVTHLFQNAFGEGLRELQTEFRTAGAHGPKWIEGRYLIFYGPDGRATRVVGVNVDITERKQSIVQLRAFTETLEEAVRERQRTEEALREEQSTLQILNRTGASLSAELDLERLVQSVTDAGVALTGARFGAFFYNVLDEQGGSYMLFALSGAERSDFERFGLPRATAVFRPTFVGEGVIRSDDILADPRYGLSEPHHGMPKGHLPVRSYLAVPVISRSGEVIGGLFFGHPDRAVFSARSEEVMVGLAAQAAIGIDNARLFQAVQRANQTLEQRVAERTSELEEAHAALRQAQKLEAIGQLTGGIAHDFNNLLTVIRGSIDLLRQPRLTDEKRQRYFEAISDTADRATRLIGQLLAFARRQALEPEVFDVSRRIDGITDMLRTVLGSRVQLEVDTTCADCFVDADVAQFEATIINLAVNARDAMDGQGRLVIRVALSHERDESLPEGGAEFVAVSLSDSGHGIAPDQIERIFEPFFTTKKIGKGTGLGLSQVYGFAKQSGGNVQVDSDVGQGATFTLYLPRAEAGRGIAAAEREHRHRSQARGRVLIVEDNPEVGEFADAALSGMGFETTLVTCAEEGLAQLESQADGFDVVFSDVVMPGIGGLALANQVRDRWPHLPVLLTSGYSDALADGPQQRFPLLRKPYSLDALATALEAALSAST